MKEPIHHFMYMEECSYHAFISASTIIVTIGLQQITEFVIILVIFIYFFNNNIFLITTNYSFLS